MPGIKQNFPGTLTGSGLKKITVDSMLNAGSLLLVDPTHPAEAWAAGVPAADARVPNIASSQARALVGANAEVRPRWSLGSAQAPANSIFERTAKGGLHGIVSQADTGEGKGAMLTIPSAILDYVWANRTHAFYASIWHRITRVSGGTTSATTPFKSAIVGVSSATGNTLFAFRSILNRPLVGGTQGGLGMRPAGGTVADQTGATLQTIAAPFYIGTNPETGAQGGAAIFGAVGPKGSSGYDLTHMPSWAIYRMYLEDLTVSGRTYAQVDADDYAKYTTEVTNAGGRYNGDSWTNPSVLA